ncbi:MAG TPA: ABC transporter permease [Mycobacteriales bacterium]|nr:ABC transporter permease [Mycobacteriales bacterium]
MLASEEIAPPRVPQLVLSGGGTPPLELIRRTWQARSLCVILARKDFYVRYRRAVFGIAWTVLLPGLQAVVLSVVMSRIARFGVPHYAVYIFSGTVLWTYLSSAIGIGGTSIVDNASLSSKSYFPRAVLPLAACISGAYAFLAGLLVLVAVAAIDGAYPDQHLLLAIPAVVLMGLFSATLTLVFAALHVYFRDVKYVISALMLLWFYVTPLFYPLSRLHGWSHTLVTLNPATGPILMMHASILGGHVPGISVVATLVAVVILGVAALLLHSRLDRNFADLL